MCIGLRIGVREVFGGSLLSFAFLFFGSSFLWARKQTSPGVVQCYNSATFLMGTFEAPKYLITAWSSFSLRS